MSDLEKFIALYKNFGIELSPIEKPHYPDHILIEMVAGETPGVGGYDGMTTTIFFTKDGKFDSQSIWE